MRRIAIAIAATLALVVSPASAQNARSFVSGQGIDTNACTLTAPCRTFQHAHDMTNANGEIDVLDTAGYGQLTINKSISIVSDGVNASVSVPSGGTGITINAQPSDAISLRGITVEGGTVGHNGIQFNTGESLTVANCVIRHATFAGINFAPNAASNLLVSNTTSSNNGNGIIVAPTGSVTVSTVFDHVETNENLTGFGIIVDGSQSTGGLINATVSDSVAAQNAAGYQANSATGHSPTTITVFHSVSANNLGTGIIAAGAPSTVRIAQSVITGNPNGWSVSGGGTVSSYQDNYIDGNATNQTAPPTVGKK